uniref:TBC1 domain family, member 4 n=1 Tax=Astyanax mexicanus TaxID=7994 RepID=A0A8B9HVU1_ASTMX
MLRGIRTSSSSSTAKPDKCFSLWYLGWSSLDRRTTLPMLPWLVAEIRRRGERTEPGPAQARPVQLSLSPPVIRCVPANSSNTSVFIFEHKAQFISRFIHNSHDLSYFAYLIRSQPEDPESEMACHVFKAGEPNQVPEVISSIRQASKAALKEDSKPKQEGEEPFYNSQKFEVLYCGKVMVAHKKAPSTLIDDCIDKFRQHEVERKRQRLLNGQRGSSETVEFIVGDDPLSSSLIEEAEAEAGDQAKVSNGKLGSSPSVGSLRGAFPECILEDSGFEEQQEFRTRCNSLAGGMQSRSVQAGAKGPTRRRHASAPNNVQPSDADKNRTMLFQVGRFEVNLISPDSKTVVLEKNFKDISSCSQGLKQTDHFGFICREAVESGSSQYLCYVFQCASESLVDEVMLTLKQAFSTAAALQSSKTQVKLCEACPMHSLHKLCERIEGLYPPRAKLAIQKHLSLLSDNEQADIFERVQRLKPSSDQEENELVILHLRQLCETKQKTHVHIGEAPQNTSNNTASDTAAGRNKLDVLKNKARSSLTSSLENIFSRVRMRMRLGSMGSFDRVSSVCDDSPGDSPPGTPPGYLEEDPDAPQFRRRAHTFSHPPIKKRISFTDAPTQAKAPLRRQHSVAPELLQSSNGEGRKRTLSGCSSDSLVVVTPRRVSWRQKIFLRVASPMNKAAASTADMDGHELLPLSPRALDPRQDALAGLLPSEQSTGGETGCRTPADYRALWKKAIHQQILLIRMEKENQRLEASRDELHIRKMKLDYQEVGECPKEVQALWERKLNVPCRTKVQWDKEEIHTPLCQGVPKGRRGEVWLLLSQQYRLRHRLPQRQQAPDTPYQDLLKQLTAQQHSILVDLGRTFPTHQYFSTQLGAGQLSLYNLLKAYSLLDTEVGYCQGISFVAGILLLHMSEEQAFDTLKFLMYDLGLRRQYRPDMISLQVRALHYIINIYRHYALKVSFVMFMHFFFACFLIVFVFCGTDLLFVQGTDVIFKVALCLLSSHEGEILECDSFECIVDYLKTTIPTLSQNQMEETITKALEMDISKQLHAYEVEYHVLQDEMMDAPQTLSEDSDRLDKLEKTNAQLKKQNMELLEKLQAARVKIQSLETSVESFLARESQMKHLIRSLEQEKTSYQKTIERMRSSLPQDSAAEVEMTQLKSGSNGKTKAASKKP